MKRLVLVYCRPDWWAVEPGSKRCGYNLLHVGWACLAAVEDPCSRWYASGVGPVDMHSWSVVYFRLVDASRGW
jgi:hypothetical protein